MKKVLLFISMLSISTPIYAQSLSIFNKILILNKHTNIENAAKIASLIDKYSFKYDLPENIVLSIMYIESRFKVNARGADGDTGLMQVMPFWTRRDLCRGYNLKDPEQNIKCGTQILRFYIDEFNNSIILGVTAYNRGETKVRRELARKRNPVHDYTRKVLKYRRFLDKIDKVVEDIELKELEAANGKEEKKE